MTAEQTTVSDIIAILEGAAPRALQEDYDNSGLQLGDASALCTGVILTVDVTPDVVAEAVATGCNLIVSHHPLLFKGLKRITGATLVERSVIEALRNGIAIYAAHTSLDNAIDGVSMEMAAMLGIKKPEVLVPMTGKMEKLVCYVPTAHAEAFRTALFAAGAGHIGNYDSCSYNLDGIGTFRPLEGSNPFVGTGGKLHYEKETRVEVIVPQWAKTTVERELRAAHPYEEPAYEFLAMTNECRQIGSGCVGELSEEMSASDFIEHVKRTFETPVARCTKLPSKPVRRVAMCGGSGGSFIGAAIGSGADAYITSDTRYHDFVDYSGTILLVDIGHHESESCTKRIFYRLITEKIPNFAVRYAQSDVNPINYV